MVFFHTKNANIVKYWYAFGCVWMTLVDFLAIWYFYCLFGIFFPNTVCCSKKNLATLVGRAFDNLTL
jgi:hypothetical protein